MNPIDLVKNYIEEKIPHMSDGKFTVDEHDPQKDAHLLQHLDGVDESHLSDDTYHVVTVSKNVNTEDNAIILQLIKVKVQGNEIKQVLSSK